MTRQHLDRIADQANKATVLVAVLFLITTVAIVIANVVSRYVLHVSLTWSAELARYAMVWSALLGAAVLVNRQQHLTVDVLKPYVRGRLRMPLQIIISLGSLTFYLILLISGGLLVTRTSGQVASSIELLPMNMVYLIMPVAALLMFLGDIVVLLRNSCDEEQTN